MAEDDQAADVVVTEQQAKHFATDILKANGVPPDNAALIAACLVAADLRGVDSHGINRLPSYLARIRAGVLDAAATPGVNQITPAVAQVDARNGFGFVATAQGIDKAVEMARIFGVGMVSVKHSNHFGMSAWICQRAVDQGMMSLVFTNSSPALPAWGSREKLLGVSPIACGAPGPEDDMPFILDMAPSVAARGKIYKALRRGDWIPEGWALDKDGAMTTDPNAALGGTMLPMGGPKGSALAIMMDGLPALLDLIFSGVMSGSAFAGGVTNPYDPSKPGDVGHFFIAIKPDLFVSLEDFRQRMQVLYDKIHESQPMIGVARIFMPGEIEQLTERQRRRDGVPMKAAEVQALNEEAKRVNSTQLEL